MKLIKIDKGDPVVYEIKRKNSIDTGVWINGATCFEEVFLPTLAEIEHNAWLYEEGSNNSDSDQESFIAGVNWLKLKL